METQDLIALLANNVAPADRNATALRYGLALAWGAAGAILMMLTLLGVRADLAEVVLLPMFWIKLLFVTGIAASGGLAAARLSRPGVRVALAPVILASPVLVVWAMAAWELAVSGAGERAEIVLGKTWEQAPLKVAVLAIPALAAALWAMKGLAPTRLALSGAAAGLLAGGIGAIAYSFHCEEMTASFIGVWYTAGVLLPVAVGTALGPIALRW